MATSSRTRSTRAWVLVLTVLAAVGGVLPATAQEVGEGPAETESPAADDLPSESAPTSEVGETPVAEEEDPEAAGGIALLPQRLPVHASAAQSGESGLVVWSEGRRAYQVVGNAGLAAYDLDTFEQVDEIVATRPTEQGEPVPALLIVNGNSPAIAPYYPVDDEGGRLFLPYTTKPLPQARGCTVTMANAADEDACLRGILVLDARTLDVLADLRFDAVGADGNASVVGPGLRAMVYSPGVDGGADKLHVLVEETAQATPAGASDHLRTNDGRQYLGQIDIRTGRTDWLVGVSACNKTSGVDLEQPQRGLFRFATGDDPAIYVGCQARGGAGVTVRALLDPEAPDAAPIAQQAFPGPPQVDSILADPAGERMLFLSAPRTGTTWWVFDGGRSAYVGAVGVGAGAGADSPGVVAPASGRLYTLAPPRGEFPQEGLFVAEARRAPLPQAEVFPEFGELLERHLLDASNGRRTDTPLAIDQPDPAGPARLFLRPGATSSQGLAPDFYYVVEDSRPPVTDAVAELIVPPSDDVPLVDGATEQVFTGAARGYGMNTILVGGLDAVYADQSQSRKFKQDSTSTDPFETVDNNVDFWAFTRLDAVDGAVRTALALLEREPPASLGATARDAYAPGLAGAGPSDGDPCGTRDRTFTFGLAGTLAFPADLQPDGSSAQAIAALTDPQTALDLEAPLTRCAAGPAAALRRLVAGQGVRVPDQTGEPSLAFPQEAASCVAPGEQTSDKRGSEITPVTTFVAEVSCDAGVATTGSSRASFVQVGPVTVGDAASTFELTTAADGRMIATMRSVARGIDIGGLVQIDAVSATAVSWATGRSQPDEVLDGDFNCEMGRTAGTCYQRTISGLTTPAYQCDQCALTNEQFTEIIQRALGTNWSVNLRTPDAVLAEGSTNGALAALQKSELELFSDEKLNNDGLATLPALELVRFNDDSNVGRGRQIYQFAGVELASVFSIQCLLEVIDGECTQRPGALSIELLDIDGVPLPGGVFELYRDVEDAVEDDAAGIDVDATPSETESPSETPSPSETESEADADPSPSETETEAAATMSGASVPLGAPAADASPSESASETESETEAEADPSASETASEEPTGEPTEDATGDATEDPSESPTGDVVEDGVSDGSLVDPLVDELVGDGSCTTGADGIGDCRFEGLMPGSYIVRQVSAPDGMLAAPDFPVTIGSADDLTATFTNVSAIGRVDITLTDGEGAPLEGGAFSLAPAGEAAAGDDDALAPLATDGGSTSGSCTTDAAGACSITVSLPDGPTDLVLSQTAAPAGFASAPPTDLTLSPGETFTFSFTNVAPAGGTITIALVDDLTDAPLAGGRFEVHADDGDGLLGGGDTLVATCTTGDDGSCLYEAAAVDAATLGRDGPLAASGTELTVPLGAYVVHQAGTLDGYEPADDIAFAFDAPGQFAAITVRNGGSGGGTVPSQSDFGSAPSFSPAPSGAGPFTMDLDVPAPQVAPTQTADLGPSVQQLLQLPADLARLVVRDPLQGLAFIATWLMFAGAAVTIHRRLMLADTLAA